MEEQFRIRRAVRQDINEIFSLMQQVKAGMEYSEWYVIDTKEYVEQHLSEQGMMFVAEAPDGTLAGYFIVDIPSLRLGKCETDWNDNLGKELCLSEEKLALVAHMDSAAIKPQYRGHHLQWRLLQAVEEELRAYPYQYYLCTIHPDNHASLHTMLRAGYVIVGTKEKYHGLKRHVLYKKKETVREKVLVSACLLGISCRYNEKGELKEALTALMRDVDLIPVCPESIGGLPTPRVPAERVGAQVINRDGIDVTKEYQKGAETALHLAKLYGCRCAVLKERSPSCGNGRIYDGTHSGTLTDGDGMTTELLKKHGISVFGENEIAACVRFLQKEPAQMTAVSEKTNC